MSIKCYQVGGSVRDALLGIRSKDIDFAIEAPDYPTMLRWIQSQGKVYLEQPEFWTVRAHLPGKPPADFVLCRKDGQYSDGRRPDSVSVGTLYDDLARRDFTVNAIAYDEETDSYIDPHDGRKDLERRLLRCVGNPRDRFMEDALRMLRAIRFAITKEFALDKTVMACLCDLSLAERLHENVSEERRREELHKCFAHNTPMTLYYLESYPAIQNACFGRNCKLWLMPTLAAWRAGRGAR